MLQIGGTQVLDLLAAFNGLAGVTEVAARSIAVGAEQLSKALTDSFKVDQRLAVINTDLRSEIDGNIQALEDTTGGLKNATKALTELRVLGFKGTNKNLTDLATRLKLSGQNTQALFTLSQSLIGLGGITEEQVDRLAGNVTRLSRDFAVTGDSIIEAINSLNSNLLDLNILGGVESAAEFTANLAANVGQENAKLAGSFARTLTSVSTNQNQLALAKLENLANEVATGAGGNFENQRQQIIQAGDAIRGLLGQQGDLTIRQLQALRPIVGEVGVQTVRLAEELKKAAPEKSFVDRISELFAVVKEKLLAPFNAAVADLTPVFQEFLMGIAITTTSFLNVIASFKPIIFGLLKGGAFIFTIAGKILNGFAEILNDVLEFFGFETKLSSAFDSVADVISEINKIGEVSKATEELASTRQMRLLDDIRRNTSESLNVDMESLALDERKQSIELSNKFDGKRLTEFQTQQLNIVDRLARSIELQRGIDELEVLRDILEETRGARNDPSKEKQPLPGASR